MTYMKDAEFDYDLECQGSLFVWWNYVQNYFMNHSFYISNCSNQLIYKKSKMLINLWFRSGFDRVLINKVWGKILMQCGVYFLFNN